MDQPIDFKSFSKDLLQGKSGVGSCGNSSSNSVLLVVAVAHCRIMGRPWRLRLVLLFGNQFNERIG